MLKLQTPVADEKCKVGISYNDKIMMLGSCFSDNIGRQLQDLGLDVCVNPFGTLYNPSSILRSVEWLTGEAEFTLEDCVQIGAGDTRWCSFSHHTSFARESSEEFLANANAALAQARKFFAQCNKVIITLGTSWCFRHVEKGFIVSNCLKRPASEFVRERLSSAEVAAALGRIAALCDRSGDGVDGVDGVDGGSAGFSAVGAGFVESSGPSGCDESVGSAGSVGSGSSCEFGGSVGSSDSRCAKQIILTVSPIRHFKDGAHGNQLSKAALLLGIDEFLSGEFLSGDSLTGEGRADYFPAYEIVMDELRDYRFYAEDMCHPSSQAVEYIRDRFLAWALPVSEYPKLEANIKLARQNKHRSLKSDR